MTTSLPQEGFAKLGAVLSVIPVSRSKWYAGVKDGTYPKPVRLNGRNVAWRVKDIRAVIADLEQKNQQSTPKG